VEGVCVKKYHPDLNPDFKAFEKIKEINQAYEIIGNEASKKIYDKQYINILGSNKWNNEPDIIRDPEIKIKTPDYFNNIFFRLIIIVVGKMMFSLIYPSHSYRNNTNNSFGTKEMSEDQSIYNFNKHSGWVNAQQVKDDSLANIFFMKSL